MSRESLGGTVTDSSEDEPVTDLDDAQPVPLELYETLDTEEPGPGPDGPPVPSQRTAGPDGAGPAGLWTGTGRRFTLAGLLAGAVALGALGGSTSANQDTQARLDAAARIVVSISPDLGPQNTDGTPLPPDTLVPVEVSATGATDGDELLVRSVRTPLGSFVLFPPVRVRPGGTTEATLLRGRPDCATVTRVSVGSAVRGTALAGSVARVRPVSTRHDVDVPVLVANPSQPLVAVGEQCLPQPPGFEDAYDVGAMTAISDGSVVLVVTPPPVRRATQPLFTLVLMFGPEEGSTSGPQAVQLRPIRADATSSTFAVPQTGWTITTTPRLPLAADTATRVVLTFGYQCNRNARRGAVPPLPKFPGDVVTAGSVFAGDRVQAPPLSWDVNPIQSAAIAAAVTACRRPPTS